MSPQEQFQKDVAEMAKNKSPNGTTTTEATTEVKPTDTGATATESTTPAEVKTESPKLTREQLIASLKEEGIDVSSLDDLKSKVAPPKQKSEDEMLFEAIDFGVKNGKFKKEEYDNAVKTNATTAKDLVYENFKNKARTKNPSLSDDVLRSRFEKKYSSEEKVEEVKDELGEVTERKVTYVLDEDEINEEAEKIRKATWQPIENIKKEFQVAEGNRQFGEQVENNVKRYVSEMPDKVKINVGENDSFDYEIDEKIKPELQNKLAESYKSFVHFNQFLKANGVKPNENFDVNAAMEYIVWNERKQNLLQIYASKKVELAVEEALKPFKNSLKKPLETTQTEGKPNIPETTEQMAQRWEKQRRGY